MIPVYDTKFTSRPAFRYMYRGVFFSNIFLIRISFKFLSSYKNNSPAYWEGIASLTVAMNLNPMFKYSFSATRVLKLKIQWRMYELTSAFATQRFCIKCMKCNFSSVERDIQRAKTFTSN